MKMFAVIYLAGKLVGFVGPLPYGVDECRARVADLIARADRNVTMPQGYTISDIRVECEWRESAPEIKNPVPLQ